MTMPGEKEGDMSTVDMRVEFLDELVSRAARQHPVTWCVKRQKEIASHELEGEECVRCPRFVLNGGVCDPL